MSTQDEECKQPPQDEQQDPPTVEVTEATVHTQESERLFRSESSLKREMSTIRKEVAHDEVDAVLEGGVLASKESFARKEAAKEQPQQETVKENDTQSNNEKTEKPQQQPQNEKPTENSADFPRRRVTKEEEAILAKEAAFRKERLRVLNTARLMALFMRRDEVAEREALTRVFVIDVEPIQRNDIAFQCYLSHRRVMFHDLEVHERRTRLKLDQRWFVNWQAICSAATKSHSAIRAMLHRRKMAHLEERNSVEHEEKLCRGRVSASAAKSWRLINEQWAELLQSRRSHIAASRLDRAHQAYLGWKDDVRRKRRKADDRRFERGVDADRVDISHRTTPYASILQRRPIAAGVTTQPDSPRTPVSSAAVPAALRLPPLLTPKRHQQKSPRVMPIHAQPHKAPMQAMLPDGLTIGQLSRAILRGALLSVPKPEQMLRNTRSKGSFAKPLSPLVPRKQKQYPDSDSQMVCRILAEPANMKLEQNMLKQIGKLSKLCRLTELECRELVPIDSPSSPNSHRSKTTTGNRIGKIDKDRVEDLKRSESSLKRQLSFERKEEARDEVDAALEGGVLASKESFARKEATKEQPQRLPRSESSLKREMSTIRKEVAHDEVDAALEGGVLASKESFARKHRTD